MPGPVALKKREYYGFPGNHFWRIMEDLFFEKFKVLDYKEKIALLKENHIALWDVIGSCTREGAGDHSIKDIKPNPILGLIHRHLSISAIFLNGRTAEKLFREHCGEAVRMPAHYLPSTSPAHASMSYEKKLKAWSVIKKYLVRRNPWC